MITSMKLKHHSVFQELSSESINWSFLRKNKNEKGYYLPDTIKTYLKDRETESRFDKVFNTIKKEVQDHRIDTIISLGSGISALEYHIKSKLDIKVIISDFDNSIETLKKFNIFDEALRIDLKTDFEIICNEKTLILLSRIDTELSDLDLINLFIKLDKLNAKYIYLIPAQILNFSTIFREIKILIYSLLLNKKRVFCGYSRTKSSFIKKWKSNYKHREVKNTNDFFIYK